MTIRKDIEDGVDQNQELLKGIEESTTPDEIEAEGELIRDGNSEEKLLELQGTLQSLVQALSKKQPEAAVELAKSAKVQKGADWAKPMWEMGFWDKIKHPIKISETAMEGPAVAMLMGDENAKKFWNTDHFKDMLPMIGQLKGLLKNPEALGLNSAQAAEIAEVAEGFEGAEMLAVI
jgi:hypothetical protein